MVNSKSKGNQFELKTLRELRQHFPVAYRSIGSGSTTDEKGDILFMIDGRKYMVECKHHKMFTDGIIDKFWSKLAREALADNHEPLLVFKENRREPVVMFFDETKLTFRVMMRWSEWLRLMRGDE